MLDISVLSRKMAEVASITADHKKSCDYARVSVALSYIGQPFYPKTVQELDADDKTVLLNFLREQKRVA